MDPIIDLINRLINIPVLNESQERRLIAIIVELILKFLPQGK